MDRHANNSGPLLVLGGVLGALYGAGQTLGTLLGEPGHWSIGPIALAGSVVLAAVGRARWKDWSARRAAARDAIPSSDRLDDDIHGVAAALNGTFVPAREASLVESLTEDDEAWNLPERYDRVSAVRDAVPIVAYWSHHNNRRTRSDVGPGMFAQGYWRVRTDLPIEREFHAVPRHWGHALSEAVGMSSHAIGDTDLDAAFVFHGDADWLRDRLTPELRELLLRYPTTLLRAYRNRIETLWPSSDIQTRSRFSDMSVLVTMLARALSGRAVFR